jgi:hypothetical protein
MDDSFTTRGGTPRGPQRPTVGIASACPRMQPGFSRRWAN